MIIFLLFFRLFRCFLQKKETIHRNVHDPFPEKLDDGLETYLIFDA